MNKNRFIYWNTIPFLLLFLIAVTGIKANANLILQSHTTAVSMELKNADIQDVLRLLAKKHKLNIITSPEVTGEITVSLKNVKVKRALDAIVKMNGYEWFQEGNIIMVKPSDMEIRGDKLTKVYKLNYVDADKVKDALAGVISSKGEITTFGMAVKGGDSEKTGAENVIIVTDVPQNIPKVSSVIAQLDVPIPQITIEVQFVETSISENEDIGINWTTKASATGGPSSSLGTATGSAGAAGQSRGFPLFGTWGGLNLATLTFQEFSVVMEMLRTSGNSKLLNNPTLSTLDNQEAFTEVNTVVPIAVPQAQNTGGLAGGSLIQTLTFEDKNIGISLKIIPHVTENDYVLLSITTSVSAITGFTGPDNDRPITSERRADTKIMVKAGNTAAIGGLIKEDEFINYKKVPYLSSIPILGRLFIHKSVQKNRNELLIFITPRIQYFPDLISK